MPVKILVQGNFICDGGFTPAIKHNTFTLGAEQLAVIGFHKYADNKYNLGRDQTIQIPKALQR